MSPDEVEALSLSSILRPEFALPLAQLLNIYTVGALLARWRSPRDQQSIERLFDSPEQARQAVGVCGGWVGITARAGHRPVAAWWPGGGDKPGLSA
jgi:hypothetical protein